MTQIIIYTNTTGGVSICYPTGEIPIEQVKINDTPAESIIVEDSILPIQHDEFFDAWELSGSTVSVNLIKSKDIAHNKRRQARAAEFAPLDIKATIPSEATAAETARAIIRAKYATMQTAIDSASTVDEIKSALETK
jgi:hypothetical protein